MSYILDALRKSDQQRQRGAAPTLIAGQAAVAAPKQPITLTYGLLAAALVGAGMVIGWLRPWQAEQALPGRTQTVAAKPLESPSVARYFLSGFMSALRYNLAAVGAAFNNLASGRF